MAWFCPNLFYLFGKASKDHISINGLSINGESQSENHDVGQWGNNAEHYSIPQLEWQHGVHGEDDEEEKRHLEK